MLSATDYYALAQPHLERGNDCVRAGDHRAAFHHYEAGVQELIHGVSRDAFKERCERYKAQANAYLAQLEQLKGLPASAAAAAGASGAAAAAAGGSGGGGGGGGGGEAAAALAAVPASVAGLVTRCNTPWAKIAGLDSVKATLREVVLAPLQFPSWFEGDEPDEKPWSGILLYGPPGTGKSLLAKAVSTELGAQEQKRFPGREAAFFSVKVSDVLKPFLGQSEARVQEIFAAARDLLPCVVFIDEIDSLGGERGGGGAGGGGGDGASDARRSVLNQILTEMDGVGKNNKGLLVLAATNAPKSLDGALLRRFQKRVYIPLPDKAARAQLMEISFGSQCVRAALRPYCGRLILTFFFPPPLPRATQAQRHDGPPAAPAHARGPARRGGQARGLQRQRH